MGRRIGAHLLSKHAALSPTALRTTRGMTRGSGVLVAPQPRTDLESDEGIATQYAEVGRAAQLVHWYAQLCGPARCHDAKPPLRLPRGGDATAPVAACVRCHGEPRGACERSERAGVRLTGWGPWQLV